MSEELLCIESNSIQTKAIETSNLEGDQLKNDFKEVLLGFVVVWDTRNFNSLCKQNWLQAFGTYLPQVAVETK